jgi:hypothetical protein
MAQTLLRARGLEDRWFTGTPERTYFETKSEPRVNRSRESFELPFDNQPTYGQTGRCTVPPKGDFLTGLTLKTILPPIYPTVPGQYVYPKPSSEVGANVYVNLGLTFAIADGVTLTANTSGNHYFSIGAQVTLSGAKTYTGSGILIYDLDGTYTITSIPTANSFTCSTTKAGVATTGTVSTIGIACADIVSYFSTQNSNLWVNNLTNKTWQITGGTNVGNVWTFTTSAPSNFPVGSQVVLNLPSSGIVNKTYIVTASTNMLFTCTINNTFLSSGVASTDNGRSFTPILYPLPGFWNGIAYGNGVFVMVGNYNQAYSTDNGQTWTPVASPLLSNWFGVTYGNGVFVMVGQYNQAYSTDNGQTWTHVASPLFGIWNSVAYGNGVFVAVAREKKAYSTDNGQTWTEVASPLEYWCGVAYGNGVFVAVGYNQYSVGLQAYSTDNGQTWTQATFPLSGYWNSVAYGNGVFVAVGYYGIQGYSTDNGQTWTPVASPLPGNWFGVTYGNGVFVMVGNSGVEAYSTDNGQTWTFSISRETSNWASVAYGIFSYTSSVSDSVSLREPPLQLLDRNFQSNVYPSISFANADDAAFWGFDARQGLTYSLPETPPWTYTQSGWITGFLPPSLSTYVDSVAHKLVKSGRILIGKQTIKEFTGEYIELQNDLWVPYENKAILKLLNGTHDQTQSVAPREYYVRIPMGFHEMPLCALTHQHLSIEFDFEQYFALSDNLNSGSGQFTDPGSFTSYNGLSLDVQTTFSYQQYIFVVSTSGQLVVYDTTKSFTDPTSYQIITALAGSTSLFSQFCVLSGVLYIGLSNGQLIRGNLNELIQGNTSSFVLNNYSPTIGTLTGTLVADFRYIYYAVSNTVNSNVFVTKYDTSSTFTSPSSYTSVDFTKTFSSTVYGVYQFISTGTELVMLPQGKQGTLYTYQLNANVQSQWYTLDYSKYGRQITEGILIGNDIYFICDNFNIFKYNDTIFTINYLNPFFVTVGDNYQMYSVDNGQTWKQVSTSFILEYWFAVAYGNGVFVMVGYNNQAYSTDNGRTWTPVASPLSGYWYSVTYGNGVFVMVGYNDIQAYSTDNGRTWTFSTFSLFPNYSWFGVAYGNGVFVAVGDIGFQVYSTDNGRTWTQATSSLSGTWRGVTYGNGVFVMVGYYNQAYSTDNGRTWTPVASPLSGYWYSVTYGNGVFVMVGYNNQAYSTDNGRTWTHVASPFSGNWFGVTYAHGVFVMAGRDNQAYSTDNGQTWTPVASPISGEWNSVSASDFKFNIPGDGFRNLRAIGTSIYASTNNVAVQIDTTKDLSTAAAYSFPAPLPTNQYIFANGPRYVYLFTQGSSEPIYRFDPYTPNTTFKASIIADYESSSEKPDKAIVPIVQSHRVTDMADLKLQGPVKEIWFIGQSGANVYEYADLSAQTSLIFNGEDIVTPDVGTHTFMNTIQPFETHTSMPVRNVSVLPFEFDPESETPNGTVNFSRIRDQVFDGGAESAWARSINLLKIQGGIGGLMFNS